MAVSRLLILITPISAEGITGVVTVESSVTGSGTNASTVAVLVITPIAVERMIPLIMTLTS